MDATYVFIRVIVQVPQPWDVNLERTFDFLCRFSFIKTKKIA